MRQNFGSKITVHRVPKRELGKAIVGCARDAIQICYKKDTSRSGNPNCAYLSDLLRSHGFEVKEGDAVPGTTLRYLCIVKAGGIATKDDVLLVLQKDHEIDLTNVNARDGHNGLWAERSTSPPSLC